MKEFISQYLKNYVVPEDERVDSMEFVFGDLVWNITGIIEFIKDHPDEVMLLSKDPSVFKKIMFLININTNYATTTDISKPGIIVEYKIGEYMLVDGWHRTWKAIEDNQLMNYYVLNYEQQLKFVSSLR